MAKGEVTYRIVAPAEAQEKTAKANAEPAVSAAALLAQVLSASLAQQAPRSLEAALAKTDADLTKLGAELTTTTGKVQAVLDLMMDKRS